MAMLESRVLFDGLQLTSDTLPNFNLQASAPPTSLRVGQTVTITETITYTGSKAESFQGFEALWDLSWDNYGLGAGLDYNVQTSWQPGDSIVLTLSGQMTADDGGAYFPGELVEFEADIGPTPTEYYNYIGVGYTETFPLDTPSSTTPGGGGDSGNGGGSGDDNDNDVSLQVNLDDTKIVPTKAKTLNLSQFFGTEQLTVPVTVTNDGSDDSDAGKADLVLYASTDGTTTNEIFQKEIPLPAVVAGATSKPIDEQIVISLANFTAGTKYNFVAALAPQFKDASENTASTDVTDSQFEYLGSPAKGVTSSGEPYNLASFFSNQYFKFIEATFANGESALIQKAAKNTVPDPTDATSWIKLFEGDTTPPGKPYRDGHTPPHPTVGYGLDLTALNAVPGLEDDLATDVKQYYMALNKPINLSTLSSDQIVQMLSSQALSGYALVTGVGKIKNQPALGQTSETALLTEALPVYQQILTDSVTSSLSATAVVAMDDFAFNSGSIYSDIAAALNESSPDYVLAAFALCNHPRTLQGGSGQILRTEAEFQNLLGAASVVAKSELTITGT